MTGTNSKICDGSNSYPAHFILKTLCKTIFNSHSLSHSFYWIIYKVKSRYYWPSIGKPIKEFCTECVSCEEQKN